MVDPARAMATGTELRVQARVSLLGLGRDRGVERDVCAMSTGVSTTSCTSATIETTTTTIIKNEKLKQGYGWAC